MVGTKRRSWRILTLAMVAVLTLSACGSDEEESGGDDRNVAKIGVIVPLLGGSTAIGIGIRNSVDLAIKQANDANTIPGWRLEIAAEDDGGKPDIGGRAATKLASDSATVAVIGTYNSSVAQQTIPILDNASIAQISPANTNDTLTRGENFATAPARPHKNYFRTATLDSLQGGFGADYATAEPTNAKTAVIVHDGKTYGKGLAESFQARFVKNGGTVLGDVKVIAEDVTDYSSDVTNILPLNPDLIFYGGEYTAAAKFTTELKKQGVTAPSSAATASSTRPTSPTPRTPPRATWARRSAPPPRGSRRPPPTWRRTPRAATATRRRPTAAWPTTRPTPSSAPWARSCRARTRSTRPPGPPSSTPSRPPASTAPPARSPSTSTATRSPSCSPSTRWPTTPGSR